MEEEDDDLKIHGLKYWNSMYMLCRSGRLCDVELSVKEDGQSLMCFPVHKVVLAASSRYFMNCLQHDNFSDSYNFDGISGDQLQAVIDYVYRQIQWEKLVAHPVGRLLVQTLQIIYHDDQESANENQHFTRKVQKRRQVPSSRRVILNPEDVETVIQDTRLLVPKKLPGRKSENINRQKQEIDDPIKEKVSQNSPINTEIEFKIQTVPAIKADNEDLDNVNSSSEKDSINKRTSFGRDECINYGSNKEIIGDGNKAHAEISKEPCNAVDDCDTDDKECKSDVKSELECRVISPILVTQQGERDTRAFMVEHTLVTKLIEKNSGNSNTILNKNEFNKEILSSNFIKENDEGKWTTKSNETDTCSKNVTVDFVIKKEPIKNENTKTKNDSACENRIKKEKPMAKYFACFAQSTPEKQVTTHSSNVAKPNNTSTNLTENRRQSSHETLMETNIEKLKAVEKNQEELNSGLKQTIDKQVSVKICVPNEMHNNNDDDDMKTAKIGNDKLQDTDESSAEDNDGDDDSIRYDTSDIDDDNGDRHTEDNVKGEEVSSNKNEPATKTEMSRSKANDFIQRRSCHYCKKDFEGTNCGLALKRHIEESHKDGVSSRMKDIHTCSRCNYSSVSLTVIRVHEKKVHKIDCGYTCEYCEDKFQLKKDYYRHLARIHKCQPYECEQCDAKFTSYEGLKHHTDTRHKKTDDKPHICDMCGKGFKIKQQLKNHQTFTHKEEPDIPCQLCERKFKQFSTLSRHLKTFHSDVRNFSCHICHRAFKTTDDRTKHVRRHFFPNKRIDQYGNKVQKHPPGLDYKCSYCDKVFQTFNQTKAHERKVHLEKQEGVCYMCTICNKTYASRHYLHMHVSNTHRAKTVECAACGHMFSFNYELRRHKSRCKGYPVGPKPYKCNYCHKTFTMKGNLTKHSQLGRCKLDDRTQPKVPHEASDFVVVLQDDEGGQVIGKMEIPSNQLHQLGIEQCAGDSINSNTANGATEETKQFHYLQQPEKVIVYNPNYVKVEQKDENTSQEFPQPLAEETYSTASITSGDSIVINDKDNNEKPVIYTSGFISTNDNDDGHKEQLVQGSSGMIINQHILPSSNFSNFQIIDRPDILGKTTVLLDSCGNHLKEFGQDGGVGGAAVVNDFLVEDMAVEEQELVIYEEDGGTP